MKFALLGTDEDALALARWVDASPEHALVAICDAVDRPDLAGVFPDATFSHVWEDLLLGSVADAVIVASSADEELRGEQLRRLLTEGMPLVVSHPAVDSVLVYYELAALAEEYGGTGVAFPPARQHPALRQVVELVRQADEGPLGALQQVSFQRAIVEREPADVRRHFARDVEVIRSICGEIVRVGAAGTTRDEGAYANLGVQMSSPSGLVARWAVEPADAAQRGTLTLRGSRGSAVLHMPAGKPWLLEISTAGDSSRQEFDPWDACAAAVDQLAAGMGRQSALPDWNDALRSMELTDALRRSVAKGRTIEITLAGETEEGTFKGVMTTLGCSVIMLGLGVLLCGAFLNFLLRLARQEVLADAVATALPFVLLAMFVLFLGLQVLKLFIERSDEDDSPETDRQIAPPSD